MRWQGQQVGLDDPNALPGMERASAIAGLLRTVENPGFARVRFHEELARSALNRVPDGSHMPFAWAIDPDRGCTHAWLDLHPDRRAEGCSRLTPGIRPSR